MLIATCCVGDMLLTLTVVIPLDAKELSDGRRTYNLTFTDIPTDKSYTRSIEGEAKALEMFAAWIVADDPEAIMLRLQELREDPAAARYLP